MVDIMEKPKLLCILHCSPPDHGAAKVGDFIISSEKLQEVFDCRFIAIRTSGSIGEIGEFNLKKIYIVLKLYIKILFALLTFRPQKIYFTASIRGVAFYRDLLLSTLWKAYKYFKSVDVYYHYHTKGITEFISTGSIKSKLTRFFIRGVNLFLLSPLQKKDFDKVKTYKQVFYLPNGVDSFFDKKTFEEYVEKKFISDVDNINVLYVSNMIKSKGYFDVLKLALLQNSFCEEVVKDLRGSFSAGDRSKLRQVYEIEDEKSVRKDWPTSLKNYSEGEPALKSKNVHFHFAGKWQNSEDEKEFFSFIQEHDLGEIVTFHGFVRGKQKEELFKKSHVFIFPTRYEAFPLSLLESLSYGVPIISTSQGSIPYILDKRSGIILEDVQKLPEAFERAKAELLNKETTNYCRKRYIENFSLEQFEKNLVENFCPGG